MNLKKQSIHDFIHSAASRSPTPGGGSVTAIASALGASMAVMAANFTIGKKKYTKVQEEIREILDKAQTCVDELEHLAIRDIKVYDKLSSAYSLSRNTDEEKTTRRKEISESAVEAAAVPLAVAQYSFRILELCHRLAEIGNKRLISDVGVSAILAEAGLRAANLNIEINLGLIKDKSCVEKYRVAITALLENGKRILEKVSKTVEKEISK